MRKFLLTALSLVVFLLLVTGLFSFTGNYITTRVSNSDSVSKKGIPLTGAQEVPAVNPSGTGTVDVSYDKSTKTLNYTATWTGMTDSVTMMHFHGPAAEGENAGVVYPIPDFTKGTAGTATGSVKIDEVKLKEADLLGGKYYYNIHTKTHPGGEIRGQIKF